MTIEGTRVSRALVGAVLALGLGAAAIAVPGSGSAAPGSVSAPTSLGSPASPHRPAEDPEADLHTDHGSLKDEYDEVIGREAALLRELEAAQREHLALATRLEELRGELHAKNLELVDAQTELDDATDRAEIAAAVAADAQQRTDRATERLRRQIVASYVTGGDDLGALAALLKADTADDASQALAFSRAVIGDTDAMVKDLERARSVRDAADEAAAEAEARATTARDRVQDAAQFIQAAHTDQQALVDQVQLQVAVEAEALREVQGRRALVEGRINAMNQSSDGVALLLAVAQRGQPDWAPGDFEITTPIPGYRIGSRFGPRLHPILGITRLHAGGDIGAPSGTPVHAAADGLVLVSGVRGGYGNTVVVDHGSSLGTLYAHLSRIDVPVGTTVERGDVIGLVGSTGLSTGPHLHFETRVRGMPIDPERVVDWDAEVDYGR